MSIKKIPFNIRNKPFKTFLYFLNTNILEVSTFEYYRLIKLLEELNIDEEKYKKLRKSLFINPKKNPYSFIIKDFKRKNVYYYNKKTLSDSYKEKIKEALLKELKLKENKNLLLEIDKTLLKLEASITESLNSGNNFLLILNLKKASFILQSFIIISKDINNNKDFQYKSEIIKTFLF